MSNDGRRSPATVDTYRRQLNNHVLPAMGAVRLAEATTPLVDRVIAAIRTKVSPATAKSWKSVISGVMGLAVRHGVITHNPVREIERIEASPRREPRALTGKERVELLRQLQADEKARRRDFPDLIFFMLATGVRIGGALAVVWSEVDFDAGTVRITSALIRVRREGLQRKGTKSRAGQRTLALPPSAIAMLRRRFMTSARVTSRCFPMSSAASVTPPTCAASSGRHAGTRRLPGSRRTRSARRRPRSSMRRRFRRAWWLTSSATRVCP